VSYTADRKIELKSWDRFLIPLPFARCRIIIGEPISVQRARSDEEFENERRKLEDALLKLGGDTLPCSVSGVAC